MNLIRTQNVGNFELTDIRIAGDRFSGRLHFGAAVQLRCAFDREVEGTYVDHVLQFETKTECDAATLKVAINTENWRGYYLWGLTGKGWMIVKNVETTK